MENETKKLTTEQCEAKVQDMLIKGKTIVIINDDDDENWDNGLAAYLSDNYNYSNLTSAFRVNLKQPKQVV